jgi:hypothetical protein
VVGDTRGLSVHGGIAPAYALRPGSEEHRTLLTAPATALEQIARPRIAPRARSGTRSRSDQRANTDVARPDERGAAYAERMLAQLTRPPVAAGAP